MSAWTVQGPHLTWNEVEKRKLSGERIPLFIVGHPYTGDHIICCGMYRVLAKDWKVIILTRPGQHKTVCLLMQGISDAETLEIAESEMDAYSHTLRDSVILRFGDHCDLPFDHNNFDIDFYRHAGIDFIERWKSFHIPEIKQVQRPAGEYKFVHDRPEANNAKLNIEGERPRAQEHIFAHRDLILGAKSIHCVSSAFAAFADSLQLVEKDLNFYPFGREIPKNINNWKIWA